MRNLYNADIISNFGIVLHTWLQSDGAKMLFCLLFNKTVETHIKLKSCAKVNNFNRMNKLCTAELPTCLKKGEDARNVTCGANKVYLFLVCHLVNGRPFKK